MTDALTQYKAEIYKNLRCCGSTKVRLMQRFDHTLSPFLEEVDAPDKETIYAAFGPPESMAGLLMSELTMEEALRYRKQALAKRIIGGILAALFMAFTITPPSIVEILCFD